MRKDIAKLDIASIIDKRPGWIVRWGVTVFWGVTIFLGIIYYIKQHIGFF